MAINIPHALPALPPSGEYSFHRLALLYTPQHPAASSPENIRSIPIYEILTKTSCPPQQANVSGLSNDSLAIFGGAPASRSTLATCNTKIFWFF